MNGSLVNPRDEPPMSSLVNDKGMSQWLLENETVPGVESGRVLRRALQIPPPFRLQQVQNNRIYDKNWL